MDHETVRESTPLETLLARARYRHGPQIYVDSARWRRMEATVFTAALVAAGIVGFVLGLAVSP